MSGETKSVERFDVVIVGAGPVGMWLAAELGLAGVSVLAIDKRESRSEHSRAMTVHARTLEIFQMRGIVSWWLNEGISVPSSHYALLPSRLDLTHLDSDFQFALSIPQKRTEEFIERHARANGVTLRSGVEALSIDASDPSKVVVRTRTADGDESRLECDYLVGCDGRTSMVRTTTGITYTGTGDAVTGVLADVETIDPTLPKSFLSHTPGGCLYIVRMSAHRTRVIALEHSTQHTPRDAPYTFEEFRATIERLADTDYGMDNPVWVTRVGSATFQADEYRHRRILLAGDAAHVHFPMGGQGMNLGIQDAMNLGWKLAAVVQNRAPESFLDSYHNERAPIGARVIEDTLAQTALASSPGREGMALRNMFASALEQHSDLNSQLAILASGIAVRYPSTTSDQQLIGSRAPNLKLTDGSHLLGLMETGSALAIGLTDVSTSIPSEVMIDAARSRITHAPAGFAAGSDPLSQTKAAIIRPDGYVAWAEPRSTDISRD